MGSKLENDGEIASVSVWKRKVRLKAALVGAKKLARLNEGTNMKSVVDEVIKTKVTGASPPPLVTDKNLFKRVAKEFSVLSPSTKRLKMNCGGNMRETVATPKMFFGTMMIIMLFSNFNTIVLITNTLLHLFNHSLKVLWS